VTRTVFQLQAKRPVRILSDSLSHYLSKIRIPTLRPLRIWRDEWDGAECF